MYEFLVQHKPAAITFIVVVIAILLVIAIKALQSVGLEKIRNIVYKGFATAENEFQYGDNYEKFEYVISIARSAIPLPFSLFITESLLRRVIQAWFDLCKDLLDNGKFDKSEKEGE
jgi:hypothetical protein